MGSTIIPIPDEASSKTQTHHHHDHHFSFVIKENDSMKLIHGIKVGVALVLVSLIYFLDPLYQEIGDDNAMWAIMTVVVTFEFYAGATLAKGLNRGMGTILGGGLGFLVAILGKKVGGIGNSILVGASMLIFGGIATYWRLRPKFKVRYDYGAMIFILTFSLVALSGLREADTVIEIARERLLMIVLGFLICIFSSLLIFPIWASDELHHSTISKFNSLATSIEECLEEYFIENKEDQQTVSFTKCNSVLNSKSKDESLANFARWEPWHGKFGMSYPWEKYLKIGEVLREVAATIISLKPCLVQLSPDKQVLRQSIKEPCEAVGTSLASSLRELGENMKKMRKCKAEAEDVMLPELKSLTIELSRMISPSYLSHPDGLAIASFVFSLMDMEQKLQDLAKQVQQLGQATCTCSF
ncbi:aluminum-activated malate transporter 14-like [Euphorbia lathyris]|uniref:aluminum-activated malate transporter 14-like n=1 Tax=Euphorbia lathyris TaxID=212925 RepID=UPI003313A1FA